MNPEPASIFHMLTSAGPVVKLVLLLLLLFSVTSWAIIFIKYRYFRKAHRDSLVFIDLFWQCRNLGDAFARARTLTSSPGSRLFLAGYMEIKKGGVTMAGTQRSAPGVRAGGDRDEETTIPALGSVKRALRRSISVETRRLSQLTPFLATAGNTAPFIGLFGTVWGIMNTFRGIGMSQSASLAVVAPGISEALVATAAGLAVAIPAVIAYNYFVTRLRLLESELQGFAADLLNLIERDIHRQKGA